MTQDEDKSLLKFLQEQEAKGYIRPSISPYASPFFFIQKKDGKLRPVQDYRRINDITISNQYPLPLITDLLTDLSGAKIFTKLDVKDGYNNIRIKEGDEHKAAFKTKYGLWEPLVMFFGLKNSPATFQNMMNYEYRDVIDFWNTRGQQFASTWMTSPLQPAPTWTIISKQYRQYLKSQNAWICISNQRSALSMPHIWITWG
jgi:hypothetical protein